MPMDPPPSRYRVVERGGRLVVIDTVVGGAPPTARELLPEGADDNSSSSFQPFPREGGAVEESIAPSRPAAAETMIAEPPGLLRNIASTVCGDRRDRDGRLQWTTARWFDAKGPRAVVLSKNGERQLGFVVLALIVAVIVAVFLVILWSVVGWAFVIVGAVALRQMQPAVTAWIDRLTRQ